MCIVIVFKKREQLSDQVSILNLRIRRWLKTLQSETSNKSYNTPPSCNDWISDHDATPVHQEKDAKYIEWCSAYCLQRLGVTGLGALVWVVRFSLTGDFSNDGGCMRSVARRSSNEEERPTFRGGEFNIFCAVSMYEWSSSGNDMITEFYNVMSFVLSI
jgi:hypothetical protein